MGMGLGFQSCNIPIPISIKDWLCNTNYLKCMCIEIFCICSDIFLLNTLDNIIQSLLKISLT